MRKAVVYTGNDFEVAKYLPARYRVTSSTDDKTYIEGEDFCGWTLDSYVIPRLASGMYHCEEIKETD